MTNLYWRGVTWLLENDRYQKIVFLAVIAAATLLGAAVALDPNS